LMGVDDEYPEIFGWKNVNVVWGLLENRSCVY
jgi:hypothetical protein